MTHICRFVQSSNAYELQLQSDFPEVQDDFIAKKAIERGYYD